MLQGGQEAAGGISACMLVSEGQPGRARWEGQGGWRVAGALQSFDFMPAGSPDASMQSTMGSTMSYEDEDDSESMVYVEAPKVPPLPPVQRCWPSALSWKVW